MPLNLKSPAFVGSLVPPPPPSPFPIMGGLFTNVPNNATNYISLYGRRFWTILEANTQLIAPTAGVRDNFTAEVVNAPTSGKSYVFTVRKNESGSDGLAVTIADTATEAKNTANSITVAKNDRLNIQSTPSGTPPFSNSARWCMEWTPDTRGEAPVFNHITNALNTGSNTFGGLNAMQTGGGTTEVFHEGLAPIAGTLSKLLAKIDTAAGAGNQWEIKNRKENLDGNMSVVLEGATETIDDDSVNSETYAVY